MIKITYFVHGATPGNEKGKATGWGDPGLSALGKKQALQLKELTKAKKFDMIFCSDLKRTIETAKIAFTETPIVDKRLRECNYGDFEGKPSNVIDAEILQRLKLPFPNGESYGDVEKRIRSFLSDLGIYNGKRIAIVAHRAPQLALDIILGGKSWEQAVKEDWRLKEPKKWQPGWDYTL